MTDRLDHPSHGIALAALAEPAHVLDLAGWYAQPLTAQAARQQLDLLRRAEQRVLAGGQSALAVHLGLLIAGFWMGRAVAQEYRSRRATAQPDARAILDLVYGQLLISCKLSGARSLLNQGFTGLAGQLAATDYFTLLKRHELLAQLPLTDTGSPPQPLSDLLIEAKIIRQLKDKAGRGRGLTGPHEDTLG